MSNPFVPIGLSHGVYHVESSAPPVSVPKQTERLSGTSPNEPVLGLKTDRATVLLRAMPSPDILKSEAPAINKYPIFIEKSKDSNTAVASDRVAKATLPSIESSPEMRRLTGLAVDGELRLKGNLSQGTMDALCRILVDPDCGLSKLVLHYGQLSVDRMRLLSEALKVNRTLIALALDGNLIGDVGAALLSEALKVNRTLNALDLGSNVIGDVGAASLSEALKVNRTLTALDLGANQIGDEGAGSLSEALKINDSLTRLEFMENEISDIGALSLTKALETNLTLASFGFEFGGSDMEVQCTASIESSLQRNQQFHLTKKHAAGFMALASGLGQFPSEISDVLIEQMAALPPHRRQESIASIEAMSAAIGGPPKKT